MHLVFRNKVNFVQEASDLLGAAGSECDVRFLLTGVVGVALEGHTGKSRNSRMKRAA